MSKSTIKIDGWNEGFKKVQASKLLRLELGLNIAKSKAIIDQVLLGEVVILTCTNHEQAELLIQKLNGLGAKALLSFKRGRV